MKRLLLTFLALFTICSIQAQLRHPTRDAMGRHQISRGFVVITSDGLGEVFYTPADYQRMARLGSNVQVIRIDPTKLGSDVAPEVKQTYGGF